jgi:hypothetical protein
VKYPKGGEPTTKPVAHAHRQKIGYPYHRGYGATIHCSGNKNRFVAVQDVDLFVCGQGNPRILIDRCYRIWVDGITWSAIR